MTINGCKKFFTFGEVVLMENNIKKYRKAKQISQDELAKKCNVTRQTINAIENNKYDPSLTLAIRIAQTLGVNIDELFIFKINN